MCVREKITDEPAEAAELKWRIKKRKRTEKRIRRMFHHEGKRKKGEVKVGRKELKTEGTEWG